MSIHPHMRKTALSPTSTSTAFPSPMNLPPSSWTWSGFALVCSFGLPGVSANLVTSLNDDRPQGLRKPQKAPYIDAPSLDPFCTPPLADEVWMARKVRDAVQGSVDVQVYVAGCPGLAKLHAKIGAPIFKIGTTEAASPNERLIDFGLQNYGSLSRNEGVWDESPGFDPWTAVTPQLDDFPSPASPVVVLPKSLGVRLPTHLSAKAFDDALVAKLRSVNLDLWARRSAVRQQLELAGIDPGLAMRASRSGQKDGTKLKEASEFYFFRKKRDFAALVAIIEAIVLEAIEADDHHSGRH